MSLGNVSLNISTNSTSSQQQEPQYTQAIFVLLVLPNVFIFVVLFFGFTSSRTEKRRQEIEDVKARIGSRDGTMIMAPRGKRPLPMRYREILKKESERENKLGTDFTPNKKDCDLPGWGRMDSDLKSTHFNTIVALSYRGPIMRRFQEENPNEQMPIGENPRDFMTRMVKRYPHLDPGSCRNYLRMYEFARFGREDINETMYSKFFEKLLKIITLMSNNQDE